MKKVIVFFISAILAGCTNPLEEEVIEGGSKTYQVKITTEPGGAGVISPSEDSVYNAGQKVEFLAIPAEDYVFAGWTGDISSSENPYSLTVDQNFSLTANFEKRNYELAVNIIGEGAVSEKIIQEQSKDYEHGTVVELTANPAEGYAFVEWQGDLTTTDNPTQIVVDEPKEVTAVFEKHNYELTINISGEGTVTERIVQSRSKDYESGTVVELTAEPDNGYEFIEWQGDVMSADNPVRITVDQPKEVTAVFERIDYEVDVQVRGRGTVTQEVIGSNFSGTQIQLTAEPANGWQFNRWEGDIPASDRKKNPVVIQVNSDKNIMVYFYNGLGGIIFGTSTLTESEGPYQLTDKIQVIRGSTLIMERGVEVYGSDGVFDESNVIEVSGELLIEGSDGSEVLLKNVVIKYGDNGEDDDWEDDDWDDEDEEDDDEDEEDEDRDDLYRIEMEHVHMIGGELIPPTNSPSSGSIELEDSFLYEVNRSSNNSEYIYIWYPQEECTIEQNIFYNSGRIDIGLNEADVKIKNNYFYRDEFLSNQTGYAIERWAGNDDSEMEIEGNTFASTQGVAVSFSSDFRNFRSKNMDARKNFWNTTSEDVIEKMIYDRNDDLRIFQEIYYHPYLKSSDHKTPVLPDSLR